jgi:putative transposase
MCMDIKYLHIHGSKRNGLLLMVIDVFSRKALIYMLKFKIRKEDVMMLLSLLFLEYRIAGFTICNDNVSLFIATMDREFLIEKGVIQEFTPVATPEENSYLDAFNSTIQREVVDRLEFESFHHAKMVFYRYYELYNNERKHNSLGRISSEEFLKKKA